MEQPLLIFQAIISLLLIIFILLQQRGSTALGSAFGGDSGSGAYSARRGIQQKLYWGTIICGALLIILTLLGLII
jgi:protein translocase SecG subunit